ncbi:MAG: cysteine--tRNA ligase [Ignavibacterium sp.]|nr:cysteine--tRNA ligase [Ignavibacterium sp.]MDW8374766.1 cysteine--tRNA ligase [Ignavibacteriales bacterium]
MIKIYNTLTKQKEELIPLNPPNIRMYMCGPTVYDYFHIGNARSFIMSDIVRRYLEYKGYNVTFVMNLTDVDDKIIKKSIEENKTSKEVAEFYINEFFKDIERLKIKRASFYPKATEFINDMIDMIKKLEQKGIAYNVDGNVFYDVTKFQDYGKLSGKNINELEAGSRVEINEEKKHPLDFALWKKAKEGEPFWESPWGKGRPGWHIECSAMSCKLLGESFDIHAGGHDLIFPHHENEIAQSEAANQKPFVKYWIHFGFLNINEEKMSKSLGNFFTAREILESYSAEAIRLFFAQAHYRGPVNFSEELIKAAEKGFEKIQNTYDRINDELKNENLPQVETDFNFNQWYEKFEQAMDDDFNTASAVATIFDFSREVNKIISEGNYNKNFLLKSKEYFDKTAEGVLGLLKSDISSNQPSLEDELIEILIKIRNEAKQNKNYTLSDKIRDELKKIGIILQDSKTGTTYKKTKK